MGIISTIQDALTAETASTEAAAESESSGAYWCDDCAVRVRDVDVESEGLAFDDGTPQCPDCGSAMRFERSHADGCAC